MTAEQAAEQGFTERLIGRYVGAVRGYGPTAEMILTGVYGAGGAVALALGHRNLAAVLALLSAFRGGVLTALARRPSTRPWQRAAGAVVNVCAEGALIAAAAAWSRAHEDHPAPYAIGFLAFGGALMLSYARTRIGASAGQDLPDGPRGIAAREVRMVVFALGLFAGEVYWTLVVVAVLANVAVVGHLVRLRFTLRG